MKAHARYLEQAHHPDRNHKQPGFDASRDDIDISKTAGDWQRASDRLHWRRLFDRRLGLHVRPDSGSQPDHSEVMVPDGAPVWMNQREELWNAVEAAEKRTDAQLVREVEFALPRELTGQRAIELACQFVRQEFVNQGAAADLSIHLKGHNPYANAMLTMRVITPEGFGRKVTEWNRRELLLQWRAHWAELANEYLHRAGYDVRIDHRGRREQTAQTGEAVHLGKAVSAMKRRGLVHERLRRLEEMKGK
jgi:ATP-dependent exoDNAse (exonuclease V) alpha subunit